MKLLAGRLTPQEGRVVKSGKLEVGYFAQHQAEELPVRETAYEYMQDQMKGIIEPRVRAHLGSFGFNKDKADTPIANLSGGEKARLLFAAMSRTAPHIMLLDEPTNHLDVDAREALIAALNTYDGAVVLVSHDPHLVELVCDTLWVVQGGTCQPFDGDLGEYRQSLLDSRKGRRTSSGGKNAQNAPQLDKKAERRARADARAATQSLRANAQKAEKNLARLNEEKTRIENELANPKIYEESSEQLKRLQIQLGKLNKSLEEAENIWLAAVAELDIVSPE